MPPEAKGRVVDTACAGIAPGQAKAPTTPTNIITFPAHGHTHEALLKKRRSNKESTSAGYFTSAGGVKWRRDYGSPSPGRRTAEQVPSAHPAPPQQLPLIAKKGKSTAGEGASGEGASSQGGGRMEDLDSDSDPDMMEV